MRSFSAIATLLVALAACGGPADAPAAAGPAFPVEKTAEAGPVRLAVRLTADKLPLEGALTLEEEVAFDPGFTAELPEFDAADFAGFGVTAIDDAPPAEAGGRTVLRRRVTLEPEKSGALEVPPREAWFRKAGEERESPVKSEAIPVTVLPIEDPAAAKPPEPRGVLTPEQAGPRGGLSPWWLSAALPVAAAVFLLVRRRRGRPLPPPPPAHEIAWEALRRLVAARLLEAGDVERFFTALSAILREYVERRFAVRAPERTTEEFLREASVHPALAGRRDGLARFLALADLVKFARHAPEESGVQASFDAVKEFVSQTAEEESVHA